MWKPGHPDNNGRRTPSYHQPFESVQDSGNGKKRSSRYSWSIAGMSHVLVKLNSKCRCYRIIAKCDSYTFGNEFECAGDTTPPKICSKFIS